MHKSSAKNLVFSSVGDGSKHKCYGWRPGSSNFDLWLCYYGDEEGKFRQDADIYESRKGSKWQNFYYIMKKYADRIKNYSCVFVVDDDIEMDPRKITHFFNLFHKYQLALAQPAFTLDSYTMWPELWERPGNILRYTNFVECGVMAFSKEALDICRKVIPDVISGNCFDWVCANLLEAQRLKIAVIDKITCRHPFRRKPEMDILMPRDAQTIEGRQLRMKYQVSEETIKIYSSVKESSSIVFMLSHVKYFFKKVKRVLGRVRLKLAQP